MAAILTSAYGDIPTAWAPLYKNGTLEFITVVFSAPVYAGGVTIRETWGNGFVNKVDVLDMSNTLHMVWSGTDLSAAGAPADFIVSWLMTAYPVKGVKIYTNTSHNLRAWEEIDSIQLHGEPVAPLSVPEPDSMLLLGSGLVGLAALRRRLFGL